MSEAQAKRRFKILMRDKVRLDERGATDAALNDQIAKLIEQFPSLGSQEVKVSESTKSMLRAGEEMSKPDDAPGQPPATVAAAKAAKSEEDSNVAEKKEEKPAEDAPAKPTPVGSSEPATPASPPPTPAVPPAPVPEKEAASKQKASSADKSLEKIATFLGVVNVVLRIWNDLRAKPTFGSKNQAKAVLCAMICGAMHCHFLEPCSIFGRLADPMLIVLYLHISNAVGASLKNSIGGGGVKQQQQQGSGGNAAGGSEAPPVVTSQRSIVERVFVYTLRDLIPSLAATYMVFMLYLTWASLTIGAVPKLFCNDE